MRNPKIDNVEILGLTIVLDGELDTENQEYIDLGSVTIMCDTREYILDVVQSYHTDENGVTTIETDLEKDEDTFPDCPYDITAVDLMNDKLVVEAYVNLSSGCDVDHLTLFVRFGGKGGMTKAINVIED